MTGEFAVSNDGIAAAFDLISRATKQYDASEIIAHRLSIVLDELASNMIRHDDTLTEESTFSIRVTRHSDDIVLHISDPGQPFNPFEFAHDRVPEIGGQGITLIKGLCSEVEYRHKDGENKVKVTIKATD